MKGDKDPTFTLFGKKICLPSDGDDLPSQATASLETEKSMSEEEEPEKESVVEKANVTLQQDDALPANDEEAVHLEDSPESSLNLKTSLIEEESSTSKSSKSEKEQTGAPFSEEKPLKKPDKILPCPRCNSMDTKFCYYNNYNVNQPRHFCKACQRYWTAGGTMRNVPVGAGRRKNKNSASQYRQITISEALQASQMDAPNGISHPALKTNGRVLNFGLDVPICESMSSVLNLGDKKVLNGTLNRFPNFELNGVPVPGKSGENSDDCSSNSSVTASSSQGDGRINPQEQPMPNINGFPTQMTCLPGGPTPWPLPWNSAVPPPGFCPSGFPMPFYPAAYWNCGVPGPWNVPWLSPQSDSSNQSSLTSGPNSPLGKHSREGNMLKPDGSQEDEQPKQKPASNGTVLVPKILRIDDPSEAAKSSIWAALGIKNESINQGGMFKGFQSKNDKKNHVPEPSPLLKANPVALSRSLNFHESV